MAIDRPRCTLILGAGFSKWCCGLPLVADLFDLAIHIDNATEKNRIRRLREFYEHWRTDHSDAHNEEFIRFAQQRVRSRKLVNWYVVRRLTDQFISTGGMRKSWYVNTYRTQKHEGIQKARTLIQALQSDYDLDLITTNYDLIVEYALGSRCFNYGVRGEQIGYKPYPYVQPVYLLGTTKLAKLHGSVSWDETRKYPDSRHGLTGKCLIIPPIREKTAPAALRQQWGLAKKILRQTDILFVFGFSFNIHDTAVRRLIARNIKSVRYILFLDATDHRTRLQFLLAARPSGFINVLNKDAKALIENIRNQVRRASKPLVS